jgi:hypothetical protein
MTPLSLIFFSVPVSSSWAGSEEIVINQESAARSKQGIIFI